MDNLVGSLSRYTQLLNPAAPVKAVISFGESEKARKAVKAVFDVAKRCAAAYLENFTRARCQLLHD